MPASSPLSSPGRVLAVVSMVVVALLWVGWIRVAVADRTPVTVAPDLVTFAAAGDLASRQDWAGVYDPDVLGETVATRTGTDLAEGATAFPYPPFVASGFALVRTLDWKTLWALWTVIGVAALVSTVRLLDGPWWAVAVALLSFPVQAMLRLGQNTWLAAVLVAAAVVLARRRRHLAAGAVAGLLVFKPTLAVGVALWWLLDPRRNARRIAGAAATTTAIVAVSVTLQRSAWHEYLAHLGDITAPTGLLRSFGVSAADLAHTLLPSSGGTVVWAILAAVMLLWFFRRGHDGPDAGSTIALALMVGSWVAPRAVVYDWSLLLVAALLIAPVATGWAWFGALNLTSVLAPTLVDAQTDRFGRGLSPAPVMMALAILSLGHRPRRRNEPA